MNKVKIGSQMYPFLNDMSGGKGWTWNPIKGSCPHACRYCYNPKLLKRFGQEWGPLRLDVKALNEELGSGNFIFVGSSTDMWADDVFEWWIDKVLGYCFKYPNKYLFQTKNPQRFNGGFVFPYDTILGITLETNRATNWVSCAPSPSRRVDDFRTLRPRMVSIEPVMDFDLLDFAQMIEVIKPEFVSIGADSGRNNLPEPAGEKLKDLIQLLEGFTRVNVKSNLTRLLA